MINFYIQECLPRCQNYMPFICYDYRLFFRLADSLEIVKRLYIYLYEKRSKDLLCAVLLDEYFMAQHLMEMLYSIDKKMIFCKKIYSHYADRMYAFCKSDKAFLVNQAFVSKAIKFRYELNILRDYIDRIIKSLVTFN